MLDGMEVGLKEGKLDEMELGEGIREGSNLG